MISKWTLDGIETSIRLPLGAKFLCVGEQEGQACVWVDDRLAQPKGRPGTRYFDYRVHLIPTGDNSPEGGVYLGSMLRHYVMWHVFVVQDQGYIDHLMQHYANNALISDEALLRDQEGVFS